MKLKWKIYHEKVPYLNIQLENKPEKENNFLPNDISVYGYTSPKVLLPHHSFWTVTKRFPSLFKSMKKVQI